MLTAVPDEDGYHQPRVNGERTDPAAGEWMRFSSAIVPAAA
jgi:hypothetical protein